MIRNKGREIRNKRKTQAAKIVAQEAPSVRVG
jgi:hypothetical protein